MGSCHLLAYDSVKINRHKFKIMLFQYIVLSLGGHPGDERSSYFFVLGFVSPFNSVNVICW